MSIDPAEFEPIAEKLDELATKPCGACGHDEFAMNPGWVQLQVEAKRTEMDIGGQAVPSVMMVCTRCGLVRLHAPAIFGM